MTSLAHTLKQYFDIAIETDPALKEVYDEKKLDECGKYINNRARKLASNNMAMVESSVVFKWARDFFYGDTEDENTKPEIAEGAEMRINEEIEVEARKLAEKKRLAAYKKMANQEEILVFIQKDGIPVATAELFAKNRIGQFYADEHSGTPEGSKPSEEVQHVFTTWLRDKPDLLKHVKKHVKLAEVA